jgi:predicted RNA-binding protein with PUA-like domain
MVSYWLIKSEPNVYSIDDLERDGSTHWDGVRNYEARNTMRDLMKRGDVVLFYHSNAKPPGAVGIARVSKEGYPDHTAFIQGKYFDPKSDPENPTWVMVDVEFDEKLPRLVSISELKADPELEGMPVTLPFQRLSVQPVAKRHFDRVLALAKKPAPA